MGTGPHFHGHRERLRERFRRGGGGALNDYELLELLLTFAVPRRDVKELAKALRARFGSLRGVLDAGPGELEAMEGMGPVSAVLVRLVKEIHVASCEEGMRKADALSSPAAVVAFAREKIAGLANEAIIAVYLNVKNEVLDTEVVAVGTIDRAAVYPRRIAEGALRAHAAAVVLVHNHPSGHTEPSGEDRELTETVARALRLLDIAVVDHVIVARDGHFSFREHRLL